MRPPAVLTPRRVPSLPDVPTTRESGIEGFEMSVWFGILAPAGTPREIIGRLNQELIRALAAPDLRERFAGSRYRAGHQHAGALCELHQERN